MKQLNENALDAALKEAREFGINAHESRISSVIHVYLKNIDEPKIQCPECEYTGKLSDWTKD